MGRRPKYMTEDNIPNLWTCSMQYSKTCHDKKGIREKKDFYLTINGSFWLGERSFICKDCIKTYCYQDGEVNLARFKKVLRVLDVPFYSSEYEAAVATPQDTIGAYFKNIYLNHKGRGFEDGEQDNLMTLIEDNFDLNEEVRNFWGAGFKPEEYEFLNNTFMDLVKNYECNDVVTELLFQNIATTQLMARKELLKGNTASFEKLVKATSTLLGDSNIKPSSKGNGNTNQILVTNLLKRFENEDPVPDPLAEWKKNDIIKKYINIFFFGHLAKMLGIRNDYSRQYDEEMNLHTVVHEEQEDDFIYGDD